MNEFWTKKLSAFAAPLLLIVAVTFQIITATARDTGLDAQSTAKPTELARIDFETAEQLRNFQKKLEPSSPLMRVVKR